MPAKIGRPKVPLKIKRRIVRGAKFRKDEAKEIDEAARRSGKGNSEWIRDTLLAAARKG